MILLVLVTLYIWKKFSSLAELKNLNKNSWAIKGILAYLSCGLGIPFVLGILSGAGIVNLDFENIGVNILLSLLCYGIGGAFAFLLYKQLESKPDNGPDIDSFGKN
jgi:hypothetical protein